MFNFIRSAYNGKVGERAKVSLFTKVRNSKVANNCHISKNCIIKNSEIGSFSDVMQRTKIQSSVLSGYNYIGSGNKLKGVNLGVFSYISNTSSLSEIVIGKFCSIGSNVQNRLGNHPTKIFVSTHPAFYSASCPTRSFSNEELFDEYGEDIVVGNDVWIGADSLLMDGINIGNGSVIAARSVVTKDVPPYAIIAGVPAKIIRFRFSEEQIKALEAIKWWDWDLTRIEQSVDALRNIDKFIDSVR